MPKDIFKTLKNYSRGFHARNDKTTNKIYDAKVKEIKVKILTDVNRGKEIINAEIKMAEFAQKTSYLGGEEQMKKCNAEWKAADNIMSALKDSKII
jgi:hypothetical protein